MYDLMRVCFALMLPEGRLALNNIQMLRDDLQGRYYAQSICPLHGRKVNETTSKVAFLHKALRPPEGTFHSLLAPLAAKTYTLKNF
ncbi:hypothetical protein DNHGIG_11860 [Collibacillus ludicampi]|uniref:Uncharacterized protein n=1 Tax=Collibacillus ludicampi TaxID=2771369 RepID=A0AAV4LCS1_9BACL|nr:hypothetical protein DNHGIG_11860 [Collibacillus ludicampi]